RNLSKQQIIDIVLNSEEIVSEIQERARESKSAGNKLGADKTNKNAQGSIDPQPKTNTAEELAKLADTSSATIKRAKKLKKENTERYKKVLDGESSLYKEYMALPTVKKPEPKKSVVDNESVTAPPKPKRDIREEMIEREASLSEEDRKKAHEGMTTENFKSYLENIRYTLQQMKDLDMNVEIKNSKE